MRNPFRYFNSSSEVNRVLDVGCGTGVVAREAARRTGAASNVAGTDINEDMLGIARAYAEKA